MEPELQYKVNEICDLFVLFAEQYQKERGKKFVVTDDNSATIKKLVLYFTEHEENTLDLTKGILVMGFVGTGKTRLMEIFNAWSLNKKKFLWARCKVLQREYTKAGFKDIDKYGLDAYKFKNNLRCRQAGYTITYCFDDFGDEKVSKSFGTEALIMEDILQDRYVEFESTGMLTHMTTNLQDGDVIQELYGIRVRDRIRAMFNIVKLNGTSFRV